MPIYTFASRSHPRVKAFTADQTGSNLPNDYAPWTPAGSRAVVPAHAQSDPVSKAVERDGYFLVSGNIKSSR
jgi:hypothetical protein